MLGSPTKRRRRAAATKWRVAPKEFDGSVSFAKRPEMKEVHDTIASGLEQLRQNPLAYQAIHYQTNMTEWPEAQQHYTLVTRDPQSKLTVQEMPDGGFTFCEALYEALKPNVPLKPDKVTALLEQRGYGGYRLSESLRPGRGEGCMDVPELRLFDDIDPSDVAQGGVGDCWLLSAISALAEFDGSVHRLFKKTQDVSARPFSEESNLYTVSLYDLPDFKPVDVVVDERLCGHPDGSRLLGAQPSPTGELWVAYLEKAVAAHCGGWEKIDGGTCTHAWRMLTGCRDCYTFQAKGNEKWRCYGIFNPNSQEWERIKNSPHEGFQGLWPMEWPTLGGGGSMHHAVDGNEMFERMCHWDDENYLIAAGTKAGSDTNTTDGIVDGHAYTVIECHNDVAGTQFDLLKLRNPWGKGEFEKGMWGDDGPGWERYPQVKAALNPLNQHNDGIFWVSKEEFFHYFPTVYLCAKDMSEFISSDHGSAACITVTTA